MQARGARPRLGANHRNLAREDAQKLPQRGLVVELVDTQA